LHTDTPVGGVRMYVGVVNVGTHGVQRHAALHLLHLAAHVGTAEPAGQADLDALGAPSHRLLHRVLHGASVANSALQLLGDALGDQLRLGFGDLDLLDLDIDLAAHLALEELAQAIDVRPLLADDDARLRGVERDVDLVGSPLDLDPRDARARELALDE